MAMRFLEGFEVGSGVSNSGTTLYARKWDAATGSITTDTGRLQGQAMHNTAVQCTWRTRSLGLQNTWVIGMGLRYANATVTDSTVAFPLIIKRGTSEQLRVQWRKVSAENTFELIIFRGATEIARTSTAGASGKFASQSWHYFEFKFKIDPGAGTGTYEIRRNTQVIISGTANTANTGLAGADVFELNYASIAQQTNFDDFYFLDDTGSINNDFLGDTVVEGRLPTGDSTPLQWSLNNGGDGSINAHWKALDDVIGGATQQNQYIFSSTVGQQDLLSFTALVFITGTVHAVQVMSDARLDVVGTRTFKHIIKSNGTLYASPGGATHSVTGTTYSDFFDVFETDPDTGVKWTVSGVNNAQFGVEVVS